jgi:6-phospho-3-hexuloisomerase
MASIIDDILAIRAQIENRENILKVCEKIKSARFCVCAGTGRTGLVMKAFAQRLSQLKFNAYDISDSNLPNVSSKDLLICASFRGENPIVLDYIDIAIKNNVSVVYITEHPQKLPHEVLQLSFGIPNEIANKYFFGSIFEIALWIFLDLVVKEVSEGRIPIHTNFL